jgi:hypothetical protein
MDYSNLYEDLKAADVEFWADLLPEQLANAFDITKHGDLIRWQTQLEDLPKICRSFVIFPSIR